VNIVIAYFLIRAAVREGVYEALIRYDKYKKGEPEEE